MVDSGTIYTQMTEEIRRFGRFIGVASGAVAVTLCAAIIDGNIERGPAVLLVRFLIAGAGFVGISSCLHLAFSKQRIQFENSSYDAIEGGSAQAAAAKFRLKREAEKQERWFQVHLSLVSIGALVLTSCVLYIAVFGPSNLLPA